MRPTKDDGAVVDLLDVLLEEGVVLQADVVVSVAEVPLLGVNLRAAIAGMATMTEHGLLEEWDREIRGRAPARTVGSGARPGGAPDDGGGGREGDDGGGGDDGTRDAGGGDVRDDDDDVGGGNDPNGGDDAGGCDPGGTARR